jgi:thiamine biosynthesis protein ThiI
MPSVVIHYQELALKGRNRPWFINLLMANVRAALADLGMTSVRSLMGRIEITFSDEADGRQDEIAARLARLPGIANFSFASPLPPDLDVLGARILADLEGLDAESFRVRVRRADKTFPVASPEIERMLGRRIQDARGWRVDLGRPALIVHVEIVPGAAFVFTRKHRGAGGLPTGSSGKVACLLSGGIDSPVAAWRMIRRGCRVSFVHFHSYPIVTRASIEKAQQLVAILTRSQLRSRLYLVPFGEVQQQIVVAAPEALRVVLYRRFMLRIASRIAGRRGAKALVTGEVIGQVASQTLDNLVTIDRAANLPVLRPLVGMDKEEIVGDARALGTYGVSILPDEDCCQLFTPRHPATGVRLPRAEEAEAALPVEALVDQAVAAASVERFAFPSSRPREVGAGATQG